jgi:hypothetical protein
MLAALSSTSQSALNSGAASGTVAAIQAAGITIEYNTALGWCVPDASVAQAESIVGAYSGSASELAFLKSQKITALEAQYETLVAAGRLYSVTGGTDATQHTYQIDEVPPFDASGKPTRRDSQGTISTMGSWAANVVNNVAGTGAWPSNFAWRDASNNMVPMTAAQCYAFTQNVAAYVAALFGVYCTLFAEINAASTASAVQAIDLTQGWPGNP